MQNKIRHGEHQRPHTLPFAVDRTNLFTGRVELHNEEEWNQPSAGLLSLTAGKSVADACGLTSMASGGTTPPMCIGVERRYDEQNSMAIYTYTFEGIATSHSQKFVDSELEFTMTQEPIETHPSFANLNDLYGPYDALNRLWPQYITQQTQQQGLTFSSTTGTGAIVNPMFGVSVYLNPGLVYRINYTDIDVDDRLFQDIGTVVKPPQLDVLFNNLKGWIAFPGARNWLKMAPKIRQHGSCISISEEYMLSDRFGWNKAVYSVGEGAGGGGPLG